MTDTLNLVGVPGIVIFLVLREVFGFLKHWRNGNAKFGKAAVVAPMAVCPDDVQREHAATLARHDELLTGDMGIVTTLARIDGRFASVDQRLGVIEQCVVKGGKGD